MSIGLLIQLFPEAPHTERYENDREGQESEEVRPERRDATSFQHAGPGDHAEVIDRVELREWLHPMRHGFHRSERSRKAGHWRIDKETCQLRLFGGFCEGRYEGADSNA